MRFVKQLLSLPLNSLSLRVLLAYLAGVILTLVCIFLVVALLSFQQSKLLLSINLKVAANGIANELVFNSQNLPVAVVEDDGDENWFFFDSLSEEAAYRVLDSSGRTVLTSSASESFWSADTELHRSQAGYFEFTQNGLYMQAVSATREHNGEHWVVQVAISSRFLSLIDKHIAVPFMARGVAVFGLVLLCVFGICAYVTLGYTLKPLRQISRAAAAISPRSLHTRLQAETVPSEIAPLVDSFNRVLDRLEQGYRTQQEFLATAAHELKTPLALIRAQIEVKDHSDDRDALLNDVAHMARQVQQLLLLAEVSEEQNYNLAIVDVADVASEVISYLRPMAEASALQVTLSCNAAASWQADRAALFTLLKNLLENAIQHAPQNSAVQIEIDAATITVRDWGPGVTPQQLPQLFVRFWRGAHRRDHGAGLGLAICHEIALAHGWVLSAHRAEPGLCFKLALP